MRTPQSNNLPPGFRFHPTDEELILHYLRKKVASIPLPVSIIAEVDIYKFNPWELPAKAAFGEKEWYFFSPRDRKYPNGARPNRAAASGYWKATGTDKNIVASLAVGERVQEHFGVKKALVFYKGRPPKGVKTNWIMHEYRLVDTNRPIRLKDTSMRLDDWVLCRIYKKSKHTSLSATTEAATTIQENEQHQEEEIEEKQITDTTFLPISRSTTLVPPPNTTLMSQKSVSFSNLLDATDYSMLSTILSENHYSNNYPTPSEGLFNYENLDEEIPQDLYNNINNNSYLFHKNPSFQHMENITRPKNQLSNIDHEDMMTMYPPKKYHSSSCNFPNTNLQNENPQLNFIFKQPLVNQQLFSGPQYLRFHE